MILTGLISSAKIWLTVCVAVMVSFATVTPDIHPVEPEEIACQDDAGTAQVSQEQEPDHPNKPPHDHHVHNCGSCHIHAMTLHPVADKYAISDPVGFNLAAHDAPPRAGPIGLYRPPRA
jgi:hypothetical protein